MLPASNLTAGLIFELGFAAAEYDIRGDCGSANREAVTSRRDKGQEYLREDRPGFCSRQSVVPSSCTSQATY